MNETFTLQQQLQLNFTGRYDDSPVLEEKVAKKEKRKKRNNKRILIVDDEPDITFTLRTILEENGFIEVDVYNEPLLALQNFKSRFYSLLITDVAMPRIDGFELYKHIKKIDDRIKVIFVTASEVNYQALRELLPVDRVDISDDEEKAIILRGSRDVDEELIHFIRKPIEIMEFIQTVNKELLVKYKAHKRLHQSSRTQPLKGIKNSRFRKY
jgi:CheY-like chemotaxis protein